MAAAPASKTAGVTLTALPARIDAQSAARGFTRPRWGNLFGLLAHRGILPPKHGQEPGALPRLERVWMPAYAILVALVSRRGPGTAWVSVDACSSAFALFERVDELRDTEVREAYFPPRLTEDAAVQAGRQGLLQYILRRRGQGDKPVVESVREVRLYYAPVWVLYYRRFRRYLDVGILDGYTGGPMGSRAKQAVLNAMIAERRARLSGEDAARGARAQGE